MKTRKNLMVLVLLSLFLSVGVADSSLESSKNPKQEKYINSVLDESNTTQERKDILYEIFYLLIDKGISLNDIKAKGLKKYLTKDSNMKDILKEFNIPKDSLLGENIVIAIEEPTLFNISEEEVKETEKNYADAEKNYADAKVYRELGDTIKEVLGE